LQEIKNRKNMTTYLIFNVDAPINNQKIGEFEFQDKETQKKKLKNKFSYVGEDLDGHIICQGPKSDKFFNN